MKINGFILPITLLFLLLFSTILSFQFYRQSLSFARHSMWNSEAYLSNEGTRQLRHFLKDGFVLSTEAEKEFELKNSVDTRVTFQKGKWGFYQWGRIEIQKGSFRKSFEFLFGKLVSSEERFGFVMEKENYPLVLSGCVEVAGINLISKSGYQRVSRFGKKRPYKESFNWPTEVSHPSPSRSQIFSKSRARWLAQSLQEMDPAEQLISGLHPPEYFPTYIEIDSGDFQPNAIVICSGARILKSFRGKIQVFSSAEIFVENGAKLIYPSALALIGENPFELTMENESSIQGILFAHNPESKISIQPEAMVIGEIHSFGKVELNGRLYGSLFCAASVFSNSLGNFQPYLVDAKIWPTKLPGYFVFSTFYPTGEDYDVLEFL